MEEDKKAGADVVETTEDTENGADNQDQGQKDGGDGAGGANADDKGDGADKSEEDKTDKTNPNNDDGEPKTRKRNIDFILERKDKKIAKLEQKANGAKDDEGEDDDVDPNDEKIIGKLVDKRLQPFIEKQAKEEDEAEISSFIQKNPEFQPYIDRVRKFASHDSRKNIPIESIFYEVAGKDLMKIGADKAQKAIDEAKKSGSGGGGDRGGDSGAKPVWDMTPAEFDAYKQDIRSKTRE